MKLPDAVLRELPAIVENETAWQNSLRLALPHLCPVMLHRQIPGLHEQAGGGWMQGAPKGAADLSGFARGGLRVEVEAKFAGRKLRPEQKRWQQICRSWGVLHLVVDGNDRELLLVQIERVADVLTTALAARGVLR